MAKNQYRKMKLTFECENTDTKVTVSNDFKGSLDIQSKNATRSQVEALLNAFERVKRGEEKE